MDSRLWCEKLRVELRRQALPTPYIDRFVAELADHIADSQTEDKSMDAQQAHERLGATQQLAAVASQEFRRRTFAGRHPVLTFIFGPVAVVPLVFVSLIAGAFACFWVIGILGEWIVGDTWPSLADETVARLDYWIVWCFNGYSRFVPFALAAWIFCRFGQQSGMRRWAIVACGIVAVMAGLVHTKITAVAENAPGLYILGLASRPDVRQLLQMLSPLAVGGWFLFRMQQHSLPTTTEPNGLLPEPRPQA